MKGIVIKSTGSWYKVLLEDKSIVECRIKGQFRIKNIKSTNPIVVGDYVVVEGTKDKNSVGTITYLEDRKNYIVRKSINLSKQLHILAANIDKAYLFVCLTQPRTSVGFIDRFLVTAEAYSIHCTLLFNKIDLYTDKDKETLNYLSNIYTKIGYDCISISSNNKEEVQTLLENLKDKVNLLVGHSGAGKSTFINSLDESLKLKTGEISEVHHKGKHTTTYAEMHLLKNGGFIIDTPGIKELSLFDMKKEEIAHYFPEMRQYLNQCKYADCTHTHEPDCKIISELKAGEISESRYNSYLSILEKEKPE